MPDYRFKEVPPEVREKAINDAEQAAYGLARGALEGALRFASTEQGQPVRDLVNLVNVTSGGQIERGLGLLHQFLEESRAAAAAKKP